MTLLLGARGRRHVVLIGDGLSLKLGDDVDSVERDDLVKLFPIEGIPVVIGHHGVNRLGPLGVEDVVNDGEFQRKLRRNWDNGLNVSIAKLIEQFDPAVSATLKSLSPAKMFGIWMAGLWPCTSVPEIAEVGWRDLGTNRVRLAVQPLGDFVIGGSGASFVKEYLSEAIDEQLDARKVFERPPEYSMDVLRRLYAIAMKRQSDSGKTVFGGQAQMALITTDGVDLGPVDIEAAE